MDQHAGGIALLASEGAVFAGGVGRDGVTVPIGHMGLAQTYHYVVNQLRQMSGALLVGKMKVVKFRRALCSCQPICD